DELEGEEEGSTMRNIDHERMSPRQSYAFDVAVHTRNAREQSATLRVGALIIQTAFLLTVAPRVHADEVSDLKETIKKLEARVQALEADRAQAKPAPTSATPTATTPTASAPAEAKAPVAGVQPLPASAAAPYVPPATM